MGQGPGNGPQYRSACTECQRRKQKCNREWPCNHCQKRKVATKCCFGLVGSQPGPSRTSSLASNRKRQLSQEEHADDADANPWGDADWDLASLGYTTSHLFVGLDSSATRKAVAAPKIYKQYYMDAASCPQLCHALQILPPRSITDSLVQHFLNHVNFYSYIIYPSSFLEKYRNWWSKRSANRPLGLQWTCLLLTVCACSAQYTDVELQRKLETDFGQSTQKLSEQYHNAARELHSVIPVGNNHLLNVQSLLHSSYWHFGEGRFVEAWHVLSTAIREAQELGIHKESVNGHMAEFDREMRRRLWCILDAWDWRLSSLLSRPLLIDRTDCDVEQPTLTLEGYTPSPLLQVKLQSEVIGRLSRRFGTAKNVVQPAHLREYEIILQSWIDQFPPAFAFDHADERDDLSRPWIVLHRHNLQTMALSMLMEPLRPYLSKPTSRTLSNAELILRSNGIGYALQLMDSLHKFFDCLYPRDVKFHYVLFCIFDTAAVLCSALIHDQDATVPRRDEILAAVDRAAEMLKQLDQVTKTARTPYKVLIKAIQQIRRSTYTVRQLTAATSRKPRSDELTLTPPSVSLAEMAVTSEPTLVKSQASYTTPPSDPVVHHDSTSQSISPPTGYGADGDGGQVFYAAPTTMAPLVSGPPMMMQPVTALPVSDSNMGYSTAYVNITPPTDEFYRPMNFDPILERDLGDLASLWNYESLNLGFINSGSAG